MGARTALSGAGDAARESPKTTARSNVAEGEVMIFYAVPPSKRILKTEFHNKTASHDTRQRIQRRREVAGAFPH